MGHAFRAPPLSFFVLTVSLPSRLLKYLGNSMDSRLVHTVRLGHFQWHLELLHPVSVLIIQSVEGV